MQRLNTTQVHTQMPSHWEASARLLLRRHELQLLALLQAQVLGNLHQLLLPLGCHLLLLRSLL